MSNHGLTSYFCDRLIRSLSAVCLTPRVIQAAPSMLPSPAAPPAEPTCDLGPWLLVSLSIFYVLYTQVSERSMQNDSWVSSGPLSLPARQLLRLVPVGAADYRVESRRLRQGSPCLVAHVSVPPSNYCRWCISFFYKKQSLFPGGCVSYCLFL